MPPAVEAWSPNHWTAGEVLRASLLEVKVLDCGRRQVQFWALGVHRDSHTQERVQKWLWVDRPPGDERRVWSPERAQVGSLPP